MNTDAKTNLAIASFAFILWICGNVMMFMVMGWEAWLGIFMLVTSYNIKWRT